MTFIERLIKRVALELSLNKNYGLARPIDVDFCYRLFLNRTPTPEEARFWNEAITEQHLTVETLTIHFAHDPEFAAHIAQRTTPEFVSYKGVQIQIRPNDALVGRALLNEGGYEPHVTRQMLSTLQTGATFVDIGANVGFFSLLAANVVGEQGRVIAFEPSPANCAMLEASIAQNHFKNIDLHQMAVADSVGHLTLETSAWSTNAQLVKSTARNHNQIDVPTIVLDDFLADVDRVDVVKMDIEGAEPLAWRGMQQVVKRFRPKLFLEFNPGMLAQLGADSPEQFLTSLQLSYNLFVIGENGVLSAEPQSHAEIMALTQGHSHVDLFGLPLA